MDHINPVSFDTIEVLAADNVAKDYNILCAFASAPTTKPLLRLWQNEQCLVVGKSITKQPFYETTKQYFKSQNIPVVTRNTGGTVVPHGEGTLNISLFLKFPQKEKPVEAAYTQLCQGIIIALAELGVVATIGPVSGSYCDGNYNVVVEGKKLVGTAQRWRRGQGNWCVLVHASLSVTDKITDLRLVSDFYDHMQWKTPLNLTAHTCLTEHYQSAETTCLNLMGVIHKALCKAFGFATLF